MGRIKRKQAPSTPGGVPLNDDGEAAIELVEAARADIPQTPPRPSGDSERQGCGADALRPGMGAAVGMAALCGYCVGTVLHYSVPGVTDSEGMTAVALGMPGTLWMRALQAAVLPLIVTNIITALLSLSELSGSRGSFVLVFLYYAVTTVAAGCGGLLWAHTVVRGLVGPSDVAAFDKPFNQHCEMKDAAGIITKVDLSCAATTSRSLRHAFVDIGNMAVPDNVFAAMEGNNLVGVLTVSIVVALATSATRGQMSGTLVQLVADANLVVMQIVDWLVLATPVGVFSLLLTTALTNDPVAALTNASAYMIACVLGAAAQLLVVYPALYLAVVRRTPVQYLGNLTSALMSGFATGSSTAALPLTLRCAEKNRINGRLAKFMLSLGSTMNMDGSTLGYTFAVYYMAYSQDITLGPADTIALLISASVGAIGSSPLPSAGLMYISLCLNSAHVPQTSLFGVVLGVDWLMDRMWTALNIAGDSFGVAIVQHLTGAQPDHPPTPSHLNDL